MHMGKRTGLADKGDAVSDLGEEVVLDLGGDGELPSLWQVLLQHSQLLGGETGMGGREEAQCQGGVRAAGREIG